MCDWRGSGDFPVTDFSDPPPDHGLDPALLAPCACAPAGTPEKAGDVLDDELEVGLFWASGGTLAKRAMNLESPGPGLQFDPVAAMVANFLFLSRIP